MRAALWTLRGVVVLVLGPGVAAGATTLAFSACSDLKQGEPMTDAGSSETTVPPSPTEDASDDQQAAADADAGIPDGPPDVVCNEAWAKPAKSLPDCVQRRVALVESGTLLVEYVSIARTSTGRVGILYNFADVEQDDLHLSHFVESAAWPPTFARATLSKGFTEHIAARGRIVAGSGDVIHVVEHEYADDGPGDVVYMKLSNGATPFSAPELIASGVPRGTHLSAALGPSGEVMAGWYVKGTAGDASVPGRFATSLRPATGVFTQPVVVENDMVDSARGVGQSSIKIDTSGSTHLLLHHSRSAFEASPRYYSSSGTGFAPRKTLENATGQNGFVGYGAAVGVFGPLKHAAYFERAASSTVAALHLASWTLPSDTPSIEVIYQNMPAPDLQNPTYAAAMAVDRWGLVHLAVIQPGSNANVGVLDYKRQTRKNGQTSWLEDVVDDDVLSSLESAFVDIVVDDRGRPHIAYRSAKDGNVYYATRLDR